MSKGEKIKKSAIIISISSDIGAAMAQRWLARGWQVFGTYRTGSSSLEDLLSRGVKSVRCDVSNANSVTEACVELQSLCSGWDVLVLCPGELNPIGPFRECNFDEWEKCVQVNFINQIRIVRQLLSTKRANSALPPCVLFFAGGATNSAPIDYSAYMISKIALIKMCELLDAEMDDVRFAIVGPGWTRTKIHQSTLKAGGKYKEVVLNKGDKGWTPMEEVLDCCDWVIESPKEWVGGRNFSVVFDKWATQELEELLAREPNMYKLRRQGNDLAVRSQHP